MLTLAHIKDMQELSELKKQAEQIAQLSVAKKRKVGAAIFQFQEDGFAYIAGGNNHTFDNSKCEDENGETLPSVIHAEESAIFTLMNQMINKTYLQQSIAYYSLSKGFPLFMICTYAPCINCAKLIQQSGIKEVYYIEKHPTKFDAVPNSPKEFLDKAGIINMSIDEAIEKIKGLSAANELMYKNF